ncbi:TACC-domain-containing protein [Rozella allomycis CSF55]|uniref:TACC-domain-containing protein n=1 Tax=Rozella allomycis (strain CSF55) TaxID=988480 RepID=A0A4P9YIB1_ROZAC|nr:TACC-domain-containing protein [Rozella allomycis CSF55]
MIGEEQVDAVSPVKSDAKSFSSPKYSIDNIASTFSNFVSSLSLSTGPKDVENDNLNKSDSSEAAKEEYYSTPSSPLDDKEGPLNNNAIEHMLIPISPIREAVKEFDPLTMSNNASEACLLPTSVFATSGESKRDQFADNFKQTFSLLDTSNDYTQPNVVFRYTEKDLQRAVSEERTKMEKENELMQLEISELQEKFEKSVAERTEMAAAVQGFERAFADLAEKSKRKEEEMNKRMEILKNDKTRLETEISTIKNSFRDLHNRYEDVKIITETYRKNEETLKENIKVLQNDVIASEERYETLKRHAETKIEEANKEIAKVRASYEMELALIRSKWSNSEITIKSLEETIATKTKENQELMKICDQLIQKMEN